MSKEYIEREAAVAFLENMAASRYLIQCFEDKEKFPTADVEPVRHGKWIQTRYAEVKRCSCCNTPINIFKEAHIYCSTCGAKMEEINVF